MKDLDYFLDKAKRKMLLNERDLIDFALRLANLTEDYSKIREKRISLLNKFTDLPTILKQEEIVLSQILNENEKASLQLLKNFATESFNYINIYKYSVSNTNSILAYLTLKNMNQRVDTLYLLLLNNKNEIIATEDLYFGTYNDLSMYNREIFSKALIHNAAKIILIRKFDGDMPFNIQKRSQDLFFKLKEIGSLIDLEIEDYILMNNNTYISFKHNKEANIVEGTYFLK